MGIKGLNKYFNTNCENALKPMHFSDLTGKKIAIDASIYIYRFLGDDALIEKMFQMINLFKYYNIIPIFIFDGKPPENKTETLQIRKHNKNKAEEKYYTLLKNNSTNIEELEKLKKQFIRINNDDIDNVKDLLRYYGIMYYDAPGEADELCAFMVKKNKVWACLSEDMDLFAYGCPRVLRYLSLIQKKVILYDTANILNVLKISYTDLKFICLLASNDYNTSNKNNIHQIIDIFKKCSKQSTYELIYKEMSKYKFLSLPDYSDIESLSEYFTLDNKLHLKVFEKQNIKFINVDYKNLQTLLSNNNFIFV